MQPSSGVSWLFLLNRLVDVIFVLSLVAKNPEVQQVGPNWDKILPDFFYLDSAPWSLKEVCPCPATHATLT